MTDKEFNFEKKRIEKFLRKWRRAGFAWFRVEHTWLRENKDGEDISAAADCTARWEYKTAWIKWYLPMFESKSDEEVERIVLHELCHILTSPIQDFSSDETRQMTEFSTSMVTSALLWASEMKND